MSAETAPHQDAGKVATEEELLTFDSMPLSSDVRRSLAEMGYERPTPVQAAVFEVATSGRDVIVQARTGTGKTSAFGLPLVDKLVTQEPTAQALVLCPTRELALQVSREVDKLGKHRGITTVAVYGGAAMGKQIDQIKQGAQIVVGTPGRTLDHMRRRTLDARNIKTLVLDESDEMLSMGFERELSAIMEHLPSDRQTLLFSATLPSDTERLAKNKLHDPELVILSGDHIGALEINHFVYMVSQEKIGAMKQILEIENPESAVIFCNTKEMTERLATALQREGYESDWLNGDLPQNDREVVMRKTREGKLRYLVATDVAARGIDISHLTHVINFDFPQDAEAYVHRTGRTGRAGNTGTAISLIMPQDIGGLYILRLTYKIRPVERQLPSAMEQRTRLEADILTSLAATFVPRGQSAEHRALARRLLAHDDAEALLAGMLHEHLNTNPELPELAQSRRRAESPAPVAAREPSSDATRGRGGRGRDERPQNGDRDNGGGRRGDGFSRRRDGSSDGGRSDAKRSDGRDATRGDSPRGDSPRGDSRRDRSGSPRRDRSDSPRGDRGDSTRSDAEAAAPVTQPAAELKSEAPPARAAAKDSVSKDSTSKDSTSKDSAAPAERPRRVRTATTTATEAAPRAAAMPEATSAPPSSPGGAIGSGIELHVDAGRKDGARVQLLKSILVDGGVSLDDVGRVRVRERYSFVEVSAQARDAAIEVLTGADLGDRKLTAKISQRSSN